MLRRFTAQLAGERAPAHICTTMWVDLRESAFSKIPAPARRFRDVTRLTDSSSARSLETLEEDDFVITDTALNANGPDDVH
ncbi:uncharacterized [Tachysurus ichikawai]